MHSALNSVSNKESVSCSRVTRVSGNGVCGVCVLCGGLSTSLHGCHGDGAAGHSGSVASLPAEAPQEVHPVLLAPRGKEPPEGPHWACTTLNFFTFFVKHFMKRSFK